MKTLQLDSKDIFGTDGSGNQIKLWLDKKHLIKVNSKLREATKEVDAYKLGRAFGLNCAKYAVIDVQLRGSLRKACITESFIIGDEIEITAADILAIDGRAIPMNLSSYDYFYILIDAMFKYTGIPAESLRVWLSDMLVFDYIICNDDRHLTNFEVLYSPSLNRYRVAPYYDHGESFLRTDASLSLREYELALRKFKSKPFSTAPEKNLCDLTSARNSFNRMMQVIRGIDGVKAVGLSSGHLLTVLRQIKRLSKLLNSE